MKTIKVALLLSFFFILTMSCNETQTPSTEIQEATATDTVPTTITRVETEKEVIKEEIPLTIFQNSFLGISPGSQIAEHEAIIEKGILKTAEVDSEVYYIKDERNTELGYFYVDYHDNSLVGSISITSPLAQTEEGIKVGDTFGDLVTKYKETIIVHGSEIEARTTAYQGSLGFRLDAAHSKHDLKLSEVSKKAKILHISIER